MNEPLPMLGHTLQITAEAVVIRNGQVVVEDLPDASDAPNSED